MSTYNLYCEDDKKMNIIFMDDRADEMGYLQLGKQFRHLIETSLGDMTPFEQAELSYDEIEVDVDTLYDWAFNICHWISGADRGTTVDGSGLAIGEGFIYTQTAIDAMASLCRVADSIHSGEGHRAVIFHG